MTPDSSRDANSSSAIRLLHDHVELRRSVCSTLGPPARGTRSRYPLRLSLNLAASLSLTTGTFDPHPSQHTLSAFISTLSSLSPSTSVDFSRHAHTTPCHCALSFLKCSAIGRPLCVHHDPRFPCPLPCCPPVIQPPRRSATMSSCILPLERHRPRRFACCASRHEAGLNTAEDQEANRRGVTNLKRL